MGHLDRLLSKDGTSWLAQGPNYTQDIQSHTQWATRRKMGHLDRLLPKDGTSWLAQEPNYTQDVQSHTQWATRRKMGHLDRLLPKDGTSWLAQEPNYTQDIQSHTQWATWWKIWHLKDGTYWQAAAEGYGTSWIAHKTRCIATHTKNATLQKKMGDILKGCCRRIGNFLFAQTQKPNYIQKVVSHTLWFTWQKLGQLHWQVAAEGWDILSSTKTNRQSKAVRYLITNRTSLVSWLTLASQTLSVSQRRSLSVSACCGTEWAWLGRLTMAKFYQKTSSPKNTNLCTHVVSQSELEPTVPQRGRVRAHHNAKATRQLSFWNLVRQKMNC